MIVRKNLAWHRVLYFTLRLNLTMIALSSIVVFLYAVMGYSFVSVPFAVIGALGTALAIFLAFRNNSSYDRWWEARKIWGEAVNYSRTFARQVLSLTSTKFQSEPWGDDNVKSFHKDLIYRHLAWLNALRLQLRRQDTWEDIEGFISKDEYDTVLKTKNKATQLVRIQSEKIKEGYDAGILEDFRHIQFDATLTQLYNIQGKAERIKNTPLPRQYDYFPRVFLYLFNFLLPLGIVSLFGDTMIAWYTVPLATMVSFIFYILMKIGEFNEDPFENRGSDTPMTALCRTIEIDLREMLGETELPDPVQPKNGFLY